MNSGEDNFKLSHEEPTTTANSQGRYVPEELALFRAHDLSIAKLDFWRKGNFNLTIFMIFVAGIFSFFVSGHVKTVIEAWELSTKRSLWIMGSLIVGSIIPVYSVEEAVRRFLARRRGMQGTTIQQAHKEVNRQLRMCESGILDLFIFLLGCGAFGLLFYPIETYLEQLQLRFQLLPPSDVIASIGIAFGGFMTLYNLATFILKRFSFESAYKEIEHAFEKGEIDQ